MSSPDIRLRPFDAADFERLMSWVPDAAAHAAWCGGHFRYPLDATQLERYLQGAQQGTACIFTALDATSMPVGHVEISHIWPHLSTRLSRVLVAPSVRQRRIGTTMVAAAVRFSFESHGIDRIDLGVSAANGPAIGCYRKLGFSEVGRWPNAITTADGTIDVCWMTLTRQVWAMQHPSA